MRIFDRLAHLLLNWRAAIIAVAFSITVVALAAAPGLRFDFTPQTLFENRDDANEFAKDIREQFGDETNALLVLWRETGADAIYTPRVLRGLRQLTRKLQKWEYATRNGVLSLTSTRIPEAADTGLGFELPFVRELVQEEVDERQAEFVKKMIKGQRLVERVLVSERGDKAMIVVSLKPEAREITKLAPMVRDLEAMIAEFAKSQPGNPELVVAGLPKVRLDIVSSLAGEQIRFMPIAAAFSALMLVLLFRSLVGVFAPLISIGAALAWTAGLMVALDQPFNIINNAMPTLLLIIGLSDSIHLVSRMGEEARAGNPRDLAIRNTVRHIGLACLLTSLTTAIGFGSLVVARTDILSSFGLLTAAGVMLAYIATIVLIPLLLSLTWRDRKPAKPRASKAPEPTAPEPTLESGGAAESVPTPQFTPEVDVPPEHPAGSRVDAVLSSIARLVTRRPWTVLIVGLLVGVPAVIAGSWTHVDTRLLETFEADHPTSLLTREMERDFAGVLPLRISIKAKEVGYFLRPGNLAKIKELQHRVESYDPDYVLLTRSIVDVLEAAADISNTKFDPLAPGADEQLEDGLSYLRRLAPELTGRFINPESNHILISVRLADLGANRGHRNIREISANITDIFGKEAADADGVLEGRAPKGDPPVVIRLAGDTYLAGIGLMALIYDLLASLALAGVLVLITIALLFRSLKFGLISIVPNVFPLLLTFGLMGMLGINLSVSTVIIFSIALGLAVDDTIHFLSRYLEERSAGHGTDEAIRRTFLGAGRAIITTTLVLIGGMFVLLQTDFMPIRYLALLTGFTVAGAIIGDLLVLPALLRIFDRHAPRADRLAEESPAPAQSEPQVDPLH